MAGYEPPSFSLGLDLGLDSEPQIAPDKHPTQTPAPRDENFGPEVMDSDPEPPRILKRLRRGPTTTPTTKTPSSHAVDDDIEDFSSEDDFLKGNNQVPFFFVFVCSFVRVYFDFEFDYPVN